METFIIFYCGCLLIKGIPSFYRIVGYTKEGFILYTPLISSVNIFYSSKKVDIEELLSKLAPIIYYWGLVIAGYYIVDNISIFNKQIFIMKIILYLIYAI